VSNVADGKDAWEAGLAWKREAAEWPSLRGYTISQEIGPTQDIAAGIAQDA
jgi:hypothetical protein